MTGDSDVVSLVSFNRSWGPRDVASCDSWGKEGSSSCSREPWGALQNVCGEHDPCSPGNGLRLVLPLASTVRKVPPTFLQCAQWRPSTFRWSFLPLSERELPRAPCAPSAPRAPNDSPTDLQR